MIRAFRSQLVLAVVVSLASAVGSAQSAGQATYKAKCQMCHGATGTPSPGMAKMMGMKPISDPDIQKLTDDQMISLGTFASHFVKAPAFAGALIVPFLHETPGVVVRWQAPVSVSLSDSNDFYGAFGMARDGFRDAAQ